MEKLDKEALAKEYAKYNYDSILVDIEIAYNEGLEYAENHYLKLIEEKDSTISRLQERRKDMTEEATRLKTELQLAKELLGESQAKL